MTLNRDRSIKRPREKWSGLVIGALPSASWGHLHRSRGGIPTRNNTTAEVYWYGTRWHGRRNKLANSVGGETASPVAGGKSSTARTWIVVGLAVCVAIIVTLIFALGPSPYERECKNSALRQGLQGLQYEEVVKVCVDLKEKGY